MTRKEFIEMKMATYQEPARKGTPKGSDIGLSRIKYHAALCLMGKPQHPYVKTMKDCFKLETSEGVLRKWRTEKEFKRINTEARIEYFKINGWE